MSDAATDAIRDEVDAEQDPLAKRVPGPVISFSDYARGGAVVGDTKDQINAFLERCLMLRKVLGAGVHPRAIGRLAELWPDAYLEVHHAPAGMVPRFTVVKVWATKQDHDEDLAAPVSAAATCSRWDQFDRRAGIAIAFKRVLLKVKRVAAREEAAAASKVEFPHDYPGAPGHDPDNPGDCFTSDCRYGCGCSAGATNSRGPNGVDPFGECPKHPDRSES